MFDFSFTDGAYNVANIIDGKTTLSPTTRGITNPSTEQVFAHVPVATREQLEEAVVAAERAFPSWSKKPWEERQQVLTDIAALLEEHAERFTEMLMREVGKDQASANFELGLGTSWLRAVAKQRLEDEVLSEDAKRVIKNKWKPHGVCAAIAPFNFPIVLAIIKLSQCLLTGNCLIFKAPPTAPCTIIKFIELSQAVLPPGVLSILYGDHDLGQWMVKHPRIMHVSLTGSTPAGKAVMRDAASELKHLTLELGGNDPAIVLDDVDPKEIAQRILLGATSNAGQTCFTMKRIYVQEKIYDAVRDELVALAQRTVKVGDPFDPDVTVGPVQNQASYERLRGIIADCKEKGYKIAYESDVPQEGRGYFVPVTIVDNPPDEARIVREEQFGPIVPLMKWREDEEVIRRANDSEFGLSSSVWGNDASRLERIADGLYNGMVWVNDWGAVGGDFPLSGTKQSGMGVESSPHGLKSWTYIQSVVCNRAFTQ